MTGPVPSASRRVVRDAERSAWARYALSVKADYKAAGSAASMRHYIPPSAATLARGALWRAAYRARELLRP